MNNPAVTEHPADGLLRLAIEERDAATHIAAEGELDMASAPELGRLLGAQHGPVVLDLRSLRFIDSSGLRVLLSAEERARRDGLDLRLASGEATQRLLALTGLTNHFSYAEPEVLPGA